MTKKTLITVFLVVMCCLIPVAPAQAEYESIYHYYIEEGLEAFYKEDFEDAIFYFKTAHAIDPTRPQPMQYLNLIKREQEGRLSSSGKTSPNKTYVSKAPENPTDPQARLISKTTEQAMYQILQSDPLQADDKVIQTALDSAISVVKNDSEDPLTESDWSNIKSQSTVAVKARVARIKARAEGNTVLSEDTIVTPKILSPLDAVKVDLESSEPIVTKPAASKIAPPKPQIPLPTEPEPFNPTGSLVEQTQRPMTIIDPTGSLRRFFENEEFRLTNDLWAQQQSLTLEIEIGKHVIFEGKNITRYLVNTQDLLEVARINKDRIRVKAAKRGTTIFYVWDDKGRWTFNVHCIYPFEGIADQKISLNQELANPFKMSYNNSWSTLHKGPTLGDMSRQNLIFTNWLGVSGETPYGDFDASINTYLFPQSTEIVGQRVGLTNGKVGPFKDFTIRGYDTFKDLSALTLPGRYFRGVALDSYAFQHKLAYSAFHGQDQSITIYSTDGNIRSQDSYIEGFRLVLNPDQEAGQYAFNYAHGYGSARLADSKDQVYSVQTQQKFKDFLINGELGYDTDEFATIIQGLRERDEMDIAVNLRDVNPGYQTVYGQPSYAGQAGASINVNVKPQEYRWDTFLDLYRDRTQPNEQNPDLINMDFSTSYSRPINDMSSWGASLGYVYTPQELSPRQFAQMGSSYSKNIKVGSTRYLSLSLSQTLQWARYKDSPTSDYDRIGLRAGMRYKLIKNLFYSLSYEYIVVRDVFNSDWSSPTALQTGLNYNTPLTDRLSLDFDLSYRNEEQSQGNFSFLSGEDSISKTISLTYRPVDRISIYMDSQLRRVWPQDTVLTPAYYDWNLMVGLRADWDLPFRWNPTGTIQGVVYKDYNGNSIQDNNEPGMANIKVLAGKYETKTNENGEYSIKASAKKVNVSLDLKTVPQGFVFSTALSRDILIEHNHAKRVDFGLTSRSGIYGVAFLDVNANGKPDRGDKFIPNIIVRLDTGEITKTDYSGSYFFENINPGKHKIKIDVSSIPINYTPTIKIETAIELEEGMTYVENIPLKENTPSEKPETK
jgi:hypothetical protein